jgi:hypothetical protein
MGAITPVTAKLPNRTAEKESRVVTTMTDLAGYLASTMVLLTFLTKDMRLLRVLGILSNVAFIAYGVLASLPLYSVCISCCCP